MARLSRIVIPQVAHHVTQRGNRRLPIFCSDCGDYALGSRALVQTGAPAINLVERQITGVFSLASNRRA